MAGNYSMNVPKLKGRDNYDDWAFAVENFLILEGIDISNSEGLSAQDNKKAKAKMVMTIDPSLYVHIKSETTVHSLWKKLKSLFDDTGFTRRISLLRSLISIRLESCDSMTAYVTQLVDTAQKLKGTGFEINDEWIGSLLLAGLPEKYAPMIMAIEHSGMNISADAIKTKLLDMSADSEITKSEGAFIAKSAYHQNARHKSKEKANGGGQGYVSENNKPGKNVKCYKCKRTGHYKNQCRSYNTNASTHNEKQMNAFSAMFLTGEFSDKDWYVDSGASTHLISESNKSLLTNISYNTETRDIVVANKESVPVLCSGDLQITTCVGDSEFNIKVNNVLCIHNLTTNLLSVSKIIASGNRVVFNKNVCHIYNQQNDCIGEANQVNGVYKLNIVKSEELLAAMAVTSSKTWHRRLGHINKSDLNAMRNGAVEGLNFQDKAEFDKSNCTVCCEGKQTRLPFPTSLSRSKEVLNLVHADLCGPMETKSLGMAKYFLLFVDDYSRMAHVYFLKSKDETFTYFKQYKNLVENQKSTKIKILRTDNGGEFCSAVMENYMKQCGIIHQKTNPYTPQQNGLCERYNRSVVEKARCLLSDAQFEKMLWAEAVHTAVYLKNRSPAAGIHQKTPFELWMGYKPDVSHIRVFGSIAMTHIPKERRLKWDKKAKKLFLVGYADNTKGYRLYDPITKTVTVARDVIIMEKECDSMTSQINVQERSDIQDSVGEKQSENVQDLSSQEAESDEQIDEHDETYVPVEELSDSEDSYHESMTLTSEDREVSSQQQNTEMSQKRTRKKPDYYGYANLCVMEDFSEEEITLNDAVNGPEKEQWQKAIREELQSFSDRDAWELVDRPVNKTVVKCKWVFKRKLNSESEVRYRARLVAKGFSQKKGTDFKETFSPVLRYSTLRLLFALSVDQNLDIVHLDVPTAFLNGLLNESIFMEIPACSNFANCENKVLKLKRAIYGLKQSARAWYQRVEELLLELGYTKSQYEPCLFMKCDGNIKVYIALFVDDFFVFYNSKETCENLKSELKAKFNIKDLGQIKKCLGMNVTVNNDSISIDQKDFVETILKRFNMYNCKSSDTPMENNLKLEKATTISQQYPYQQLLGALMYLCVLTRPDIAFAVSFLSQYNNCYSEIHWKHLKRVLKYLNKTKHYGLKYVKSNCNLIGYVDADWASCSIDRRSYTGFVFKMSGCAISYECRKQKTVALSSTEAEYMALSEACKEAIYLKNLVCEIMKTKIENVPVTLLSDNQSSQKLASNPLYHRRTKHIDVRHHFIRECVTNNLVQISYLPTNDMPADVLTKSLCHVKHYKFINGIGLTQIK